MALGSSTVLCLGSLTTTNSGNESARKGGGNLTSFGGGLSPLPAWVRHQDRVWLWVSAKLLINGARIEIKKGLAA